MLIKYTTCFFENKGFLNAKKVKRSIEEKAGTVALTTRLKGCRTTRVIKRGSRSRDKDLVIKKLLML